jgi:hypothetical protein
MSSALFIGEVLIIVLVFVAATKKTEFGRNRFTGRPNSPRTARFVLFTIGFLLTIALLLKIFGVL